MTRYAQCSLDITQSSGLAMYKCLLFRRKALSPVADKYIDIKIPVTVTQSCLTQRRVAWPMNPPSQCCTQSEDGSATYGILWTNQRKNEDSYSSLMRRFSLLLVLVCTARFPGSRPHHANMETRVLHQIYGPDQYQRRFCFWNVGANLELKKLGHVTESDIGRKTLTSMVTNSTTSRQLSPSAAFCHKFRVISSLPEFLRTSGFPPTRFVFLRSNRQQWVTDIGITGDLVSPNVLPQPGKDFHANHRHPLLRRQVHIDCSKHEHETNDSHRPR